MRPPSPFAVAVVLAMLLTGCGGGGDAELGSGVSPGSTSSTIEGTPTAPTSQPGSNTTAPGPGPGPTNPPTGPTPGPTNPPAPAPPPSELARIQLRLTRVGSLDQPTAMAARADGGLYIAEKRGRVRVIRDGQVDPAVVLDIAGDVSTGTEQGLLGLTFSGDGGRLYLNYTDKDGDTHIVEYGMAGNAADPNTRREVLFVEQPFANNNGGQLAFGPDGRLWIGLGDGGAAGDPADNAQSLGNLLGKVLRIDPRPNGGQAYTVPSDNPFVGAPGARPEIWAYGLRNPWRFSFDRANGDLWIGDVGQSSVEEVDFQAAAEGGGQNYGWNRVEGSKPYTGRPPANAKGPIYDYGRSGGNCAITGGYVYRGSRISGLAAAYVFADYCVGAIRAIRQEGGRVIDEKAFNAGVRFLSSFGQDLAGELYALSQEGGIFRIDPA